ncbi:hypothetical protein BGX34_006605 [Mortierella sp. NVP85]|nr:hypothetical protein BGX34_006605 [Mortierella sp. NVP85]
MADAAAAVNIFLRNVKPKAFYGQPTEDPEIWLRELNELFDLMGVPAGNRPQPSQTWARTLPAVDELEDPWDDFQESLLRRFRSPNIEFFARTRLYELKQRTSVTNYITQFENLRAKLNDFGTAEALQVFLQGLKPELQKHFAGNPDLRNNLEQVMQIAESLDSVNHRNRYTSYAPCRNEPAYPGITRLRKKGETEKEGHASYAMKSDIKQEGVPRIN